MSRSLERFRLARLVRRARRGDRKAFAKLFRALHPLVHGYLAARVRVRADAEDLTAVTLHRFTEQLPRFDESRGGVRAWVMTMARNALVDHLRRTRRSDASSPTDVDMLADVRFSPERLEADPRLLQIRDALAEHPPTTREMFALRYGEGLSVAEVAAVLSMSESAAKQRFSRTLRALRRKLDTPDEKEVVHAPS